eukprot:scaffold294549_cov35-Attheya_sp.AAC.1
MRSTVGAIHWRLGIVEDERRSVANPITMTVEDKLAGALRGILIFQTAHVPAPPAPPPVPAPALPPAETAVLALVSAPETAPAPETPALNALVSASASESTNTIDIVMYAESSLGKRSDPRELPWAYTALRKRNPEASEHYINHLTIVENGGTAPDREESTAMSENW